MSSLARGSLLIAAGTVYKILLTVLIDKYLATQLGVEDFGQFKYGITIVLLLSTFCTLGFNSSIIRSIAIQGSIVKKRVLITVSLILTASVSLFVVLLGAIKSNLFSINAPFLYATVFFSLNTLYSSIYSGLEKPTLKAWINDIFGFTAYLLFLWCFFTFFNNASEIAYVYLIYTMAVFVINLISSRKFYQRIDAKVFSSEIFKEYVSYTGPLFGVSILIILSVNLDKIILNYFVSEEQLGIYYSIFNISNLLPLILTILVFMYLPRMSKFLEKDKLNQATLLSSYSSKWTMIMASFFFGSIFYYGEDIIRILYSESFVGGVMALKILALGQWINVSLGFTGQNLIAIGDSRSQLHIRTFTFVLGGVLLYFGSKSYGNIGAAISILIALTCSNVMQILVLKRKHKFVGYKKQNLFAFVIIIITGLFLSYLHKSVFFKELNFLISLTLDLCIFTSVLFVAKVLGKKDIKILKITEG